MSTQETLVQYNVSIIEQGLELLADLDAELYSKPEPKVASSGIGSHFRHIIDFYERFLSGLEENRIDYDLRQRDQSLETNKGAAGQRCKRLIAQLEALTGRPASTINVKADAVGEKIEPWSESSLERELQFLLSHTVHHYALIAVILRLNGIEPSESFGVAPSTLRYWQESGACAR